MRVLLLAPQPFYTVRGTPIAVRHLAKSLGRRGWSVDLLTYHEGQDVSLPGVRVLRIPRLPLIRRIRPGLSWKKLVCDIVMFFEAIRLARRNRYDYIHAVEESVFMAMAISRWTGIRYGYDMDSSMADQVVASHPVFRPLQFFMRRCEAAAIRAAAIVLPVCEALEARARDIGARRVVLLRDPPLFTRVKAASRKQNGEVCFAYVGNLEWYQGIDLLLRGFSKLVAGGMCAMLMVVGGVEEEVEHYRSRMRSFGVPPARVQFMGPVPPELVCNVLEGADVLVSPRVQGINTPMKIYSYLSAGKPVLATDISAHTQVLTRDVALLVHPDPEDLAAGMSQLARDVSLRNKLGERAAQLVEDKYSMKAYEQAIENFCVEVESFAPAAA